ncbi:DUF4124 domain-containing protein [Stutzerimonas stutzeri]|uniref:DUF4124 domain-containing protein n=1 Tax=Stutzerimonas stutzeri TaxID=316 RepID=A0A6I6LMQ2_STUST|nr:DUF4124 domain-containing protein [Stutzerimonas stutzeri]QGZ31778.1 DUF4124 domain-containing protein [Stutzerimonas stutzeri]
MRKPLAAGCCALLLASTSLLAANVYRCTDENGNLTFTRQGCPADQAVRVQQVRNPTPGSGKAVPLAKPDTRRQGSSEPSVKPLTVVGEPDDGCGNRITGSVRRNAMISQQIRAGMSRDDIESIFGTPDTVTTRDGQVQYRYTRDKGNTRTISFDEHGCVRGKR